jgi:hypothetical protein
MYKSWTGDSMTSDCEAALEDLACLSAYPLCPDSSGTIGGVAYLPPCEDMCIRAHNACRGQKSAKVPSCASLPPANCAHYVPTGFFALPAAQGPYDSLPVLYAPLFAIWTLTAMLWSYFALYLRPTTCLPLARIISFLPLLKAANSGIALGFWNACNELRMCYYWMNLTYVNSNLFYESMQ